MAIKWEKKNNMLHEDTFLTDKSSLNQVLHLVKGFAVSVWEWNDWTFTPHLDDLCCLRSFDRLIFVYFYYHVTRKSPLSWNAFFLYDVVRVHVLLWETQFET